MSGSGPVTLSVRSAYIRGVEAVPVTVEVSLSEGLPAFNIVGLAEVSAGEARMRIKCALKTARYRMPRKSLTVNLAPGDVRKTGSSFDLPITIALLAVSGQIPLPGIDDYLYVGELALSGDVKPVTGEVAYELLCRDLSVGLATGWTPCHVPLEGIRRGFLESIGSLRAGMGEALRPFRGAGAVQKPEPEPDFSDVIGQEVAKRGMAVAAAGELGLLMVGSPGSGKSMLARRMTSILPPLEGRDRLEALRINSVAGEDLSRLLAGHRPFRSPHHSISTAGLVGGGRPARPGEISLAHGGCLFLDELAEFPTNVLQLLRQPMEEGRIRIVRAEGSFSFPSRFQFLAASNPCPCGYLGDREVPCTCSVATIQRYQAKLAGPLIDRIDIVIDVARPDPELIVRGARGLSSADLAQVVERGRAFRAWRAGRRISALKARDQGMPPAGTLVTEGAEGTDGAIEGVVDAFDIDDAGRDTLLALARKNHLTGRGISRLCKIARTIADIAESELVSGEHVLEGSMYQGRRVDA